MSGATGKGSSGKPKSLNELFAHSHVFLTGVTGFIGVGLLNRILKLEPGPEKVYVLVRNKYDVDAHKRFNNILSSPVLMALPKSKLERVQVVVGDCALKQLGISKEDRETITAKCSLVFHSAGLISFAASYDRLIRCNTLGTRNVLELAKNMPNLKAFVHVSTSYIGFQKSSDGSTIKEKVYHTPLDPIEYTDLVDKVSAEELENRIVMRIGKEFGNGYPLSKILAESLLDRERGTLPISIVRPSNVLNAWKEPAPGWHDNLKNACLGMMIGISYGILRSYSLAREPVVDVIPVDMAISAILAAALSAAQDSSKMHVYNCTTGSVNPLRLEDYLKYSLWAGRKHPADTMIFYPNINLEGSFFRHQVRCWLFQLIPCYALAIAERILGQVSNKPYQMSARKLLFYQWKFYKGALYTHNFLLNRWSFDRKEADRLVEFLSPEEQEQHPIDPRQVHWKDYVESCVIGSRRFGGSISQEVNDRAVTKLKWLKLLWLSSPLIGLTLIYFFLTFFGVTGKISLLISVCIIGFLIWL